MLVERVEEALSRNHGVHQPIRVRVPVQMATVDRYGIFPNILVPKSMLSILVFPFHVVASIIRFVFGTLRIPLPQWRFSSLNFYRPLGGRGAPPSYDPYSVADRWVRSLEDETGALCMSRARVGSTATFSDSHSAGSSNTSALPSSANIRGRYGSTSRKILPDFFLGSYEEALQTCQREAKIGCIVLVSNEHDDVAEFKRYARRRSSY